MLTPVASFDDIRDAIRVFNDSLFDQRLGLGLLASTRYWVQDPESGDFGPGKFCGFKGLSAEAYQQERNGEPRDSRFSGDKTRESIEDVADNKFEVNETLKHQCVEWAEARFGHDAVARLSQDKWRFLKLPETTRGGARRERESDGLRVARLPLLVCRTAWMDSYRGVTATDTPTGGGAWVKEHGFGHEAFNFKPVGDEYFGYVQPPHTGINHGRGINLARLGAAVEDDQLDGVTVAWVATHPSERGTRVIGWYLNATVLAEFQDPVATEGRALPDGNVPRFLVRAREPDAVLLDRDERVFEVPRGKGGMGQSNVWYPDATAAALILKYIDLRRWGASTSKPKHASRLLDMERRLRVERAAMTAAAKWYTGRGYEVEDVSMARVGWDLEARLNRARLKIEVKGTSLGAGQFVVEVTPNEYAKMTSEDDRDAYRLCVVTDCEESPTVAIFSWSSEAGAWTTGDGLRHLTIEERIAARISSPK